MLQPSWCAHDKGYLLNAQPHLCNHEGPAATLFTPSRPHHLLQWDKWATWQAYHVVWELHSIQPQDPTAEKIIWVSPPTTDTSYNNLLALWMTPFTHPMVSSPSCHLADSTGPSVPPDSATISSLKQPDYSTPCCLPVPNQASQKLNPSVPLHAALYKAETDNLWKAKHIAATDITIVVTLPSSLQFTLQYFKGSEYLLSALVTPCSVCALYVVL